MIADPCALAVGLGEIKVSANPQEVLVAYGLGSCLGVAMYDPRAHLGGLLHAVLPQNPNDAASRSAHYVDSGIAQLLAEMKQAGAVRSRLVVRIAGGANILAVPELTHAFTVGDRNIAMARTTLWAYRLPPQGQDVGGNTGRTMRLYVADGRVTVRVIGSEERVI
jgi:chemotaxis protein CheD